MIVAVTAEEIPELVLILLALGVSGYITVRLADTLKGRVEAILR